MSAGTDASGGKTWFGHPRGLSTLFFTELWERFSYYGMKAMLFLYITALAMDGGLGIGEEKGGAISGLYNSLVYLMALPGGWLADRLIGQRKAVLLGAIIIALGHYSMAVPGFLEWRVERGLDDADIAAQEQLTAQIVAARDLVDAKQDEITKVEDQFDAALLVGEPVEALELRKDALEEELTSLQGELRAVDDQFVERYQPGGTLPFFYVGLLLIIFGTGLLKPNISTMVGELYPGDMGARRDAGFSIFYMGINLGAFAAPLACGGVRDWLGWHFGFGLAGIGMTFGVIWYLLDGRYLGTAGLEPKIPVEERSRAKMQATIGGLVVGGAVVLLAVLQMTGGVHLTWLGVADALGYGILALVGLFLGYVAFFNHLTWPETKKVLVIGILFLFTAMFWSGFEQASTSLNKFAEKFTDRVIFGWEMPTEFLQSVNPLFIIALSPVFGAIWIRLASKNMNPNIPLKFALGLLQLSLGFFVIMFAAGLASGMPGVTGDAGVGVMPTWLCLMYLLFTTGELCLSPVGLSSITKLAPKRYVSQMMGIWFIAAALGNLIAGRVGGQIEHLPHEQVFRIVAFIIGGAGLVMLAISPLVQKRMMGDVR